MKNILNQITKYSIYLLVFLMPLFFLPFSFETFEFNKQYLLFFLVSIAFLSWLARMIFIDREIKIKTSPLDIFVLVFFLFALLSAVFTVNTNASLFGFYGRFSDGLISLFSLVLFYFLIINNVGLKIKKNLKTENESLNQELNSETYLKKSDKASIEESLTESKQDQKELISVEAILRVFLVSIFFIVFFSYFSVFGVWQKMSESINLPLIMQQVIFNPTGGSLEGLAIFLAVVIVFLVGINIKEKKELTNDKFEKIIRISGWVLFIAVFGLLMIINFNPAWLVILLSSILFLFVALLKKIFKEEVNKMLPIVFLIIFSIIFLFIPESGSQKYFLEEQLPQEKVLSQKISWSVSLKSATESFKTGILGSGIGTFHYDFAKFKPIEMNQTDFWQIRFDRSGSYLSEILGTMGFLGLLSYLALIVMFSLASFLFLEKRKNSIVFLIIISALFLGQLFFYQNTVLAFSFWFFLALSVTNWQKSLKEKTVSFKDAPELYLVFSVLLTIFILVFGGMYFFAGKFYLADVNFKNYFETEDITKLEKAIKLNPYQSQYHIILTRTYLNNIINESYKPANEIDEEVLANNIFLVIDSAKKATEISPNRVSVWETMGVVYREIQGIAVGATEWGIKSFEKATELEPANPVLHTELGKLYFFDGNNDKAREQFIKAKELMPGYADAVIQLALLYEVEENIEEAIKQMQDLVSFYPYNVEAIFQLGRFRLNNNQLDEAIEQFEWAIQLFPNHSNSLYSLGVTYQRKGEKEKAITFFEKVLDLNPNNENVLSKIQELNLEITETKQDEKTTEDFNGQEEE